MKTSSRIAWLMVAIALAGCGKPEPAPDPLKAQRNAVQKARDVNDVVNKAAATMRNNIDEAEKK